jgi:hypothetical protein
MIARGYLIAIDDWKAPFEVAKACGVKRPVPYLKRLVNAGWAKYGAANNTYKITEAGRKALANI